LPAGQGFFLDAWRDSAGDLHATRLRRIFKPCMSCSICPCSTPKSADCVILVTPTYLAFVIQHPAFRPLPRACTAGYGGGASSGEICYQD